MSKNIKGQENKRYPAFTDDDRLTFGIHTDEKLSDVPADYLEWLWNRSPEPLNKSATGYVSVHKTKLANYIWNSRHALNKELKDDLIT